MGVRRLGMPTIHKFILDARARLERAGIPAGEAAIAADLLARHALGGWDRGQLIADWREPAPPGFASRYEPLIARRERREPAAYILGTREFWGLDFDVAPGVLVPRPETELIVEEVLARVSTGSAVGPVQLRIADVGTGSGCLAVTLAREIPAARVVATDVSDAALGIARRNSSRLGVSARIEFVHGDVFAGREGPFDVIVSNPPYIPAGDLIGLQPEVRQFEPERALISGVDGLDIVRRLVPESARRLAPDGWLVFEFGCGQEKAVAAIVRGDERLLLIGLREDLAGIPRIAIAQRRRNA